MARPRTSTITLVPKQWIPIVILVIGLSIAVPQLHIFKDSFHRFHRLDYPLLLLAFGAIALTFVLGALVYRILAFKTVGYGKTLVVQVAANFVNRLLPAGVGGMGANYRYLRRQKHSAAQAASVVAANNGLGLVGHSLLVVILIVAVHGQVAPIHIKTQILLVVFGVGAACAILAVGLPTLRKRLLVGLQSFLIQLSRYRLRPLSLLTALAVQICLTLTNITSFWLCAQALHVGLSFAAALLIFTLGFSIGNVLPTPGGLGGVEAGLAAGLAAYQVSGPTAVATVLVYRLISYWLPLLISAPIFAYAVRRRYF